MAKWSRCDRAPGSQITNDWVAMDYIMNNDPRYQDLLTDVDEDGNA
jgi:4-hydroxybutyryl-CoA dehydratase/vinylacetyl-CoA-Delta-isomerase